MNKVQKKQIIEWLDNPVTIAFKQAAEQERDGSLAEKGLGAFRPFEAHKTQELIAGFIGEAAAWNLVIETLEGEGLWELDDEE